MIQTLTGTNSYMLRESLHRIAAQFTKQYGDLALERIDAGEVEYRKILDSVQAMPFLTSKRMIILRDPSTNKQLSEKIEELIGAVPETTRLIITEHKLDKRSSLYKTLKKQTDIQEFSDLDEQGLAKWLTETTQQRVGEMSLHDARLLVQRVGVDQMRLSNELAKLLSFDNKISKDSIEMLTVASPQSTVFALLDAAFAGNAKAAVRIYIEQRQQKVEPQAILGMLAWQFYVLATIKAAGQRSLDQIAKEAKINPFVVRKSQSIAKRITLAQLRALIDETLDVDRRMKTQTIDADDAMQALLIKIAS